MSITINGTSGISGVDGSASTPAVQGTDTNTGIVFPAADTVTVATGGSERVRVDSNGNVGIGISTPQNKLQVDDGGASQTGILRINNPSNANNNYGAQLLFSNINGGTYRLMASVTAIRTNTASNYNSDLLFATNSSANGDSLTERMRIDSSGNVLIGKTSATSNGGVLQVSNGITFPATQSACSDVNTLDDYEEGTFSPTITGTTAAGTGTYAAQAGAYTKVGNTVFFSGYIEWSAHTGTGNMNLTNLPFTSKNDNSAQSAIRIYVQTAITLTAGKILQGSVAKNSTQVNLGQTATGGSDDAAVPLDTSAAFMFSGHYIVP